MSNEVKDELTIQQIMADPSWHTGNPDFAAWVSAQDTSAWSKFDLSACRLGWEAAAALRQDAGAGGGVATETVTFAEAEVMAQEAYQEGHSDGRAEAKGATVEFWEMAHCWAVQHRFIDEPDGDGHTAQDLMDAILVAFGELKPKRAAPQPSAPEGLREALQWYADQVEGCRKLGSVGDPFRRALDKDGGKRAMDALSAASPSPPAGRDATEEGWPRTLDEWGGDDGDVVWWALDENGQWRGEAAWIGTPLDLGRGYALSIGDHDFVVNLGGWPGYHTHWTRHPDIPTIPAAPKPETAQKGGKS